jgi:hypothetical protein
MASFLGNVQRSIGCKGFIRRRSTVSSDNVPTTWSTSQPFARAVSIARAGVSARTAQSDRRSPTPSFIAVITNACAITSPLGLPRPDHCRALRILDLEPVPGRPRPIGRAQPLRHNALKTHTARVPEDCSAVIIGVIAEHDAEPAPAQQPRQALLAVAQGQAAEVLAVVAPGDRRRTAWPR